MNKAEIIQKVISVGLAVTTKPKDRLATFAKLNAIEEDMEQDLRRESESKRQIPEILLTGPKLVKAKSTFTSTQSVTIETEE